MKDIVEGEEVMALEMGLDPGMEMEMETATVMAPVWVARRSRRERNGGDTDSFRVSRSSFSLLVYRTRSWSWTIPMLSCCCCWV